MDFIEQDGVGLIEKVFILKIRHWRAPFPGFEHARPIAPAPCTSHVDRFN